MAFTLLHHITRDPGLKGLRPESKIDNRTARKKKCYSRPFSTLIHISESQKIRKIRNTCLCGHTHTHTHTCENI